MSEINAEGYHVSLPFVYNHIKNNTKHRFQNYPRKMWRNKTNASALLDRLQYYIIFNQTQTLQISY